jgi:hypothetical protein
MHLAGAYRKRDNFQTSLIPVKFLAVSNPLRTLRSSERCSSADPFFDSHFFCRANNVPSRCLLWMRKGGLHVCVVDSCR